MSLVDTWIKAETGHGHTLTSAVAAMNEQTGSRYTVSRVGEWRRGVRDVPATARRYMLKAALPVALADAGLRRRVNVDTLVEALT